MRRQPPPSRLHQILDKADICEGSYDVPYHTPYNKTSWVSYAPEAHVYTPYGSFNFEPPIGFMVETSSTVSV